MSMLLLLVLGAAMPPQRREQQAAEPVHCALFAPFHLCCPPPQFVVAFWPLHTPSNLCTWPEVEVNKDVHA